MTESQAAEMLQHFENIEGQLGLLAVVARIAFGYLVLREAFRAYIGPNLFG